MPRYGLVIDLRTCIGCGACVAACSEENTPLLQMVARDADVPLGGRRDVYTEEIGRFPSVARVHHHRTCMHCDNAPCIAVCPTGASFRTDEGVVLIDYEKCIGCKYCIVACPYGARYVNEALGGPDKCTMCYHRITQGLEPACASSCPTDSIVFGDLDDPESPVQKLLHHARPVAPELGTKPKVHVIPP